MTSFLDLLSSPGYDGTRSSSGHPYFWEKINIQSCTHYATDSHSTHTAPDHWLRDSTNLSARLYFRVKIFVCWCTTNVRWRRITKYSPGGGLLLQLHGHQQTKPFGHDSAVIKASFWKWDVPFAMTAWTPSTSFSCSSSRRSINDIATAPQELLPVEEFPTISHNFPPVTLN